MKRIAAWMVVAKDKWLSKLFMVSQQPIFRTRRDAREWVGADKQLRIIQVYLSAKRGK